MFSIQSNLVSEFKLSDVKTVATCQTPTTDQPGPQKEGKNHVEKKQKSSCQTEEKIFHKRSIQTKSPVPL